MRFDLFHMTCFSNTWHLINFPTEIQKGRRHHDQPTRRFCLLLHVFHTIVDWWAHQQHAWATPIWFVIYLPVFAFRKVAEVVRLHVHQPAVDRQLQEALPQIAAEQFGKQCENIKPHEPTQTERLLAAFCRGFCGWSFFSGSLVRTFR